jgi:hypothetical protein
MARPGARALAGTIEVIDTGCCLRGTSIVPTGNLIRLVIPVESVDAYGRWPISAG